MAILDSLKVSDETFKKTMGVYYQDEKMTYDIMHVQQEAIVEFNKDKEYEIIPKEKMIKYA